MISTYVVILDGILIHVNGAWRILSSIVSLGKLTHEKFAASFSIGNWHSVSGRRFLHWKR
jgi:hypothetical protein